jgi:protein CpxP
LQLDLDESQQKEIFTLMKQHMSEREVKQAEFKKQKENGTEITSEQRFEMQNSMLDKQIQHKTAMKTILSEDQFEQWEKTMKTRKRSGNRKGMKNDDRKSRQHKNRK